MKPVATLDYKREGDLQGRKMKMVFDEDSIEHIMGLLTDLYSDAEMAIIREYSTNALDAHTEAGQTRPIEVSTPSSLSPFFKVKDYGVGLSYDDIENIYRKYGKSTKRGTDTQTGMLGLGCKSALTYTNQFTMVAIKDGIKCNVMISREEDGTGATEVISETPTTEPNGVEIIIPVRFSSTFEKKVKTFFSYWQPGTVLLNGREPDLIVNTAKKVADGMYMVPTNNSESIDRVVMGNVAYPAKNGLAGKHTNWYKDFQVIAFVPIGRLKFAPSREDLQYTNLTTQTLADLNKKFEDSIHGSAQDTIDACATYAEALEAYLEYQSMMPRIGTSFTYKGEAIKQTYTLDKDEPEHFVFRPHAMRNAVSRSKTVSYKDVTKSLMVTGFDFEQVTPTQRTKARTYLSDNNLNLNTVIFVKGEVPGLPWTANATTVHYDTIKAIRLNRAPKGTRVKRTAKYDVLNMETGYFYETDEIDDSQNVYYFSPSDYAKGGHGRLRHLFPDDIIVRIGKNRYDKFLRDFPNAKPIHPLIKPAAQKVRDSLTENDKVYMSMNSWSQAHVARFKGQPIDDPEIVAYINAVTGDTSPAIEKWEIVKGTLSALEIYYGYDWLNVAPQSDKSIMTTKYPLLGNLGNHTRISHAVMYMNAVYNDKEK